MTSDLQTPPTRFRLTPLLAVCAGYFMVILDVTIINVAVPSIGTEFSTSLTGIQWITDGYTLVFAGLLLTGGALGDRFGNRRIFCTGVVVFTLASAGCALAWNTGSLIVFRFLEGLGAAFIVPGSLALLQQTFTTPAHRARAFGLWGSIAGAAACAGPLLGGIITSTIGWRWVFIINLPVGIACLVLTRLHIEASERQPGRAVDWPAQVLVVVAVAAVVGALNQAGDHGWTSPATLGGLALTVAAVVGLVVRERLAQAPVLPAALLTRPLVGGITVGFLFNFAFYSMIFTASLDFQRDEGFSALQTGLAILPAMVTTVFASALSGRLAGRYPHRRLMTIGLLVGAAGLAAWALTGAHPLYLLLVLPMAAAGFGTSFTLTGATTTVMTSAPPTHTGTASALFNTTRQVGSATGVALSGSILATMSYASGTPTSMLIGATAFLAAVVVTLITIGRPSP